MFFGRDTEITEVVDRLHPVAATQANRLVNPLVSSGAGKSSLVQAGVVPWLRQRRGGWIVVPSVVPWGSSSAEPHPESRGSGPRTFHRGRAPPSLCGRASHRFRPTKRSGASDR